MACLKIGTLVIVQNTVQQHICGIKPSFSNEGNTTVSLLHQTIAPGSQAVLNYGDRFIDDKIDIKFIPSSNPDNDINKLVINYGTYE